MPAACAEPVQSRAPIAIAGRNPRFLIVVLSSESDLEAAEENLFILAVAGRGTALEPGGLVVEEQPQAPVEVPVEAHRPGLGRAGGAGDAGEDREGGVVELQLAVAGGDLEGPPGVGRGAEDLLRIDAPVGGGVAGEHPGARHLPRLVLQGIGDGVAPHVLAGDHVLREQAERAAVEVPLGGEAEVGAVRDRGAGGGAVRAVGEEIHLAGGLVGRQARGRGGAGLVPLAGRDAEAEALERPAPGDERLEEQAAGRLLAVVGVGVGAGAVRGPVEDPQRVAPPPAREVAADLDAEVAVGHQVGGQGALDEQQVGGRLQALEAHGRLEFAGADAEGRVEARLHVGVLEHGLTLAEVGHDAEVEDLVDRPLEDRPHAAQDEGLDLRLLLVAGPEPAVELHVAAQPEHVVAVARTQREAVFAGGRLAGGLGLLVGGLLVDLDLAVEDADLLVQLLDLVVDGLRSRRRVLGLVLSADGYRQGQQPQAERNCKVFHRCLQVSSPHDTASGERTMSTGSREVSGSNLPTKPPSPIRPSRPGSGAPSTSRSCLPSATWARISSRTPPLRMRVSTGTPRRRRVRALRSRKRAAWFSSWVASWGSRVLSGSTVRIVTSAPRWRASRPEKETSSLPGSPPATQMSSRAGGWTPLPGATPSAGASSRWCWPAASTSSAISTPSLGGRERITRSHGRRETSSATASAGGSAVRRVSSAARPLPSASRASWSARSPEPSAAAGPSTATRAWARRASSPPSARAARERADVSSPKRVSSRNLSPGWTSAWTRCTPTKVESPGRSGKRRARSCERVASTQISSRPKGTGGAMARTPGMGGRRSRSRSKEPTNERCSTTARPSRGQAR